MKEKMDFKKVLVSFLTIASLVLLAASVSATTYTFSSATLPTTATAGSDVANISDIQVNGLSLKGTASPVISVVSGDTVDVKVIFTAAANAEQVRVKATMEGDASDSVATTGYFDVESGKTYVKTLSLKVPSDLTQDQVSKTLNLDVKVWNSDLTTEVDSIAMRVQRASFDASIDAVNVDSTVKAGALFPVEVVLKNTGYDNLQDMSVSVKVSALGISKTMFFGDMIPTDDTSNTPNNGDTTDTVVGRMYVQMPYNVQPGAYTLEVTASNSDTSSTKSIQLNVQNDVPQQIIQTSAGLLFANPTNSLELYKVVFPDNSEQLLSVSAGSTQTLDVKANSDNYVVSVTDMSGKVAGSFTFKAAQQSTTIAGSPVVVVTVILGIVFLVLLVVLIVLLSRKPQKEESGESYY